MSGRSKKSGDWVTEIVIQAFIFGVIAVGFFLMSFIKKQIHEAMIKNIAEKNRIEEKTRILKEEKRIADEKRIAMNKKRRPINV